MRKIVPTVAFALWTFVGACALKADDQTDPHAIVNRAVKAGGGEEVLAKTKASTWNETGTFYGMGDGLPFKGSYAADLPGKFKMAIEGVFTIIQNGDKGWMNGAEMSGDQLSEMKESNYAGWVSSLAPLKDKAFTLTVLDEIKVGGEPAVGVKVAHEGHRDVKLYFNKKTGLLAKWVFRAKPEDLGGKEVDQDTELREYKDMDGAKIPMKFVIQRDGKRYVEAEIRDWKGFDKLDDSVFKP